MRTRGMMSLAVCAINLAWAAGAEQEGIAQDARQQAREILDATGCQGGLIVHLGCGDGRVTAALRANDRYLVHGYDTDAAGVETARAHIRLQGLYGRVCADRLTSNRLPYAENMVNLLVVEDAEGVSPEEMLRVLVPGGVVCAKSADTWSQTIKPRGSEIDEWTHWLHGPDGNAVAADSVAGPPRRMQWIAGPLWSRHHETMPSVSAMVSAGGRIFYIVDEAPVSMQGESPDQWALVARDAFNGIQLWRIPIDDWGWKAWSTFWKERFNQPNQIPKRLVASGDTVYVTLGFNAPLTALDAATGEIRRTYPGTEFTDEILYEDGVLVLSINHSAQKPGLVADDPPVKKSVVALRADTGAQLWKTGSYTGTSTKTGPVERVTHLLLAARGGRVFLVDREAVVAIDLKSGGQLWRSPRPEVKRYTSRYHHCMSDMSTLVATDEMVFFCQLEPIQQRIGWGVIKARLQAYSAATGEVLWDHPCGNWGHFCSPDLFVAGGLVWVHHDESKTLVGLDPKTGEQKRARTTEVAFTNGHHHRCYRNKATERFFISSFRGLEFLDWNTTDTGLNHWVRGTCRLGILPCNGMVYATPHPCDCYITSKLNGVIALTPEGKAVSGSRKADNEARLQRGPAYQQQAVGLSARRSPLSDDWPTYRHDPARSGTTRSSLPDQLEKAWEIDVGARPTACVAVGDTVFAAASREVFALDAQTGKRRWTFITGGPLDTPPTVVGDSAFFGSTDGWVYCLRAADGQLRWRFRGAPRERLVGAYGNVQSAWPIHGSVIVDQGVVYFTAGRSSHLDGGILAYSLDVRSGKVLSEQTLATPYTMKVDWGRDPSIDTGLLSDLLVGQTDGIYMRQRKLFGLQGAKAGAGPLRSTAGLLDDTWFSRVRWHLGDRPCADYMVFDSTAIYGVRARGAMSGTGGFFTPGADGYELFAASMDSAGKANAQAPAKPAAKKKRPSLSKRWSIRVPVRVSSMVLAGQTLVAAGTPDILDPDDPWAAYEGRRGGVLLTLSSAEGAVLSRCTLDAPPVLDGLTVGGGCLFISKTNGRIACFR